MSDIYIHFEEGIDGDDSVIAVYRNGIIPFRRRLQDQFDLSLVSDLADSLGIPVEITDQAKEVLGIR